MAGTKGGGGSGIYGGALDATEDIGSDSVDASLDDGGLGGDITHPDGHDGISFGQGGGGAGPGGNGGNAADGKRGDIFYGSGPPGEGGPGGNPGYAVRINNVQVVWVGGFTSEKVKGVVG